MQRIKNISAHISIAAISLIALNTHAIDDHTRTNQDKWQFKGSILGYSESDRVSVLEAIASAKYQMDTDQSFSGKITFDTLTGASPNGAIAANQDQVFTSPSGSRYEVARNDMPNIEGFKDTRVALSGNWQKRRSRMVDMTLGANFSKEYDYQSLGISSLFAFDLSNKNSTLSVGTALSDDTIDPEGGVPNPLAVMTKSGTKQPKTDDTENKTTFDTILGWSQVINPYSLLQLNYSYSYSSGYHTDPYKVISVVDSVMGEIVIEDAAANLSRVIYENRPEERTKHALYGLYKTSVLDKDVFEISYRYMTDDWGIDSHTIDTRYRFRLGSISFLRPHFRYYQQSEADFFQVFIQDGAEPVNTGSQFISSDYRLGKLTTYTLGLEYGRDTANPWSVALEYYLQQPEEPGGKYGDLQNRTLLEKVDAVMLRLVYAF